MALSEIDVEICDRLAALRADGDAFVPIADVGEIVTEILEATRDGSDAIDPKLLRELEALSTSSSMSSDTAGDISLDEIRVTHIPTAKDELDEIVSATEIATDSIMNALEHIEKLAGALDQDTLDQVTSHVLSIYQACSFQDITGQRITKVTEVLGSIESVADSALASLGDEAARQRVEAYQEEQSLRNEKRGDEANLLNGPQLEGSGNSQDDIDSLLASFD